MRANELVVGEHYVMEGSGIIRHFYDLSPTGKARYRSYDLYDGNYILTSHCAVEDLLYRTERKATQEEISRLREPKAQIEYRRSSLGKALKQTKDR